MRLRQTTIGLVLSFFLVNLVFPAFTGAMADTSTSYKVDVSALNGGGDFSKSTTYHLDSTIVGFVNGQMGNSGSYTVGSGLAYLELFCANNVVEFGETCDDGNLVNGDGCSNVCQLEVGAVCGNGVITLPETCDDNNLANGDGCSNTCAVEPGFACVGAPSICAPIAVCGNAIVQGVEQCDDGNLVGGDGCSAACTIEGGGGGGGGGYAPGCGNSIKDSGEECDLGNKNGKLGESCNQQCKQVKPDTTPHCGNGAKESSEECDDKNSLSGDGCSSTCKIESPFQIAICGNKIVESGEMCDDGKQCADGKGCMLENDCSSVPGTDKTCKPRNDDGCSNQCKVEQPEEAKGKRTLTIIGHPEKRVNAPNNWSTLSRVVFYERSSGRIVFQTTIQLGLHGISGFSTDKIPDGVYDISLKGLSHLTKFVRGFRIDSETEVIDFSRSGRDFLVAGDVHESKDDFVNGLDISATVRSLYSDDIHADLNHDGLVNALDISIVVGNIYKTGEKLKI